jgi:hypothetical protein
MVLVAVMAFAPFVDRPGAGSHSGLRTPGRPEDTSPEKFFTGDDPVVREGSVDRQRRVAHVQHDIVMEVLRDPLAQAMLGSVPLARLGYNGVDGAPRVVPVGYFWNGSVLVVCTAVKAPKVRALETDPRVALSIDTDGQPPHVLLVRGTATVDIVDGVPSEFLEASKGSMPPDQQAQFETEVRSLYPQMAKITIEPSWAKLLDFETRMPSAVAGLINERG